MVVKHHTQCRSHAAGDAQLSIGLGAESIVGSLGIELVGTLIPEGSHKGRYVVVEGHRPGFCTAPAEFGNLILHLVKPPLHVVGDVVGLETALYGIAQHEVIAYTVVAAHDDEALRG